MMFDPRNYLGPQMDILPGMQYLDDMPRRMVVRPVEVYPDVKRFNTDGDIEHRWRETEHAAYEELVQTISVVPKPPDVSKHTSLIERELARLRDPNYTGVMGNGMDRRYPGVSGSD